MLAVAADWEEVEEELPELLPLLLLLLVWSCLRGVVFLRLEGTLTTGGEAASTTADAVLSGGETEIPLPLLPLLLLVMYCASLEKWDRLSCCCCKLLLLLIGGTGTLIHEGEILLVGTAAAS